MKQRTKNQKAINHRNRGTDGKGTSKYAIKVAKGNQMYVGAGKSSCFAHQLLKGWPFK